MKKKILKTRSKNVILYGKHFLCVFIYRYTITFFKIHKIVVVLFWSRLLITTFTLSTNCHKVNGPFRKTRINEKRSYRFREMNIKHTIPALIPVHCVKFCFLSVCLNVVGKCRCFLKVFRRFKNRMDCTISNTIALSCSSAKLEKHTGRRNSKKGGMRWDNEKTGISRLCRFPLVIHLPRFAGYDRSTISTHDRGNRGNRVIHVGR